MSFLLMKEAGMQEGVCRKWPFKMVCRSLRACRQNAAVQSAAAPFQSRRCQQSRSQRQVAAVTHIIAS